MKKLCFPQQISSNYIAKIIKLLAIGIFSNSLALLSSQLPSIAAAGCNYYGCWGTYTGGCNYYGCWENSGGCNYYGCWHSSEGSCNYYGCTNNGQCNYYGCPPSVNNRSYSVRKAVICTGNEFLNWFYVTRIADGKQFGDFGEKLSLEVCQQVVKASNSQLVCTGNEFLNWFYLTRISDGNKLGELLSLQTCLQLTNYR